MTAKQARQEILKGVIPGVRGPGCNSIVMDDGRTYSVVGEHSALIERYFPDGSVERVEAASVKGEASLGGWSCDELGGIYIK